MPVTKLNRTWVCPPLLTDGRICQISTFRINDLAFLLLGNLRTKLIRKEQTIFRCLTSGLIQRFFRLVNPRPIKFRSFSASSSVSAQDIRYSSNRFNSVSAFSISGTVREQYINFRFVGKNYESRIKVGDQGETESGPVGKTRLMRVKKQFCPCQRAFPRHSDPIQTSLGRFKQPGETLQLHPMFS
jgi:hypothetical protein